MTVDLGRRRFCGQHVDERGELSVEAISNSLLDLYEWRGLVHVSVSKGMVAVDYTVLDAVTIPQTPVNPLVAERDALKVKS